MQARHVKGALILTPVINIAAFLLFAAGPAAVFVFLRQTGDFYPAMLAGSVAGCLSASALMLCAGVQNRNITLRLNAICLASLAIICAASLSTAHTSYPPIVWRSTFLLITFAATFYIFYIFISDSGDPSSALWIVPVFSLFFILLAALQYFDRDLLPIKSRYAGDLWRGFRAYAVFGNPNLLADFLAIALPVCIGLSVFYKTPRMRLLAATASFAIIPCLIIAGSRGALLGASAGSATLLALLFATGVRRPALPAVVLVLLVIGAVSVAVLFKNTGVKQDSVRQRFMAWNISLSMIRNSPVTGVGFDRFGREYLTGQAAYFKKPEHSREASLANIEKQRHAHNDYLQIAAETGVPGLIAFIAFIAAIFLRLLRSALARGPYSQLAASLLGALCAYCAISFFSFPLRIPITTSMLALLAACAASCPYPAIPLSAGLKFPSTEFLSIRRVRLEACAFIILVAFLALIDLSVEPLLSAALTKAGQRSYNGGLTAEAQSFCGKALTVDRLNGDAAYCMALAYLATGHYDESEYFLRMSLRTIDDPFIHYNLGVANFKMKNYPGAEAEFKTMRDMVPAYSGRMIDIARLYKSAQLYQTAVEYYKSAIPLIKADARRFPADPVPHLMLADCSYELGDIAGYKLHLEEALKRSPSDARIIKALENLRLSAQKKTP